MKSNTGFRMVCLGALFWCLVGLCVWGTDQTSGSAPLPKPALDQSGEAALDQEIRLTLEALLIQALELPEDRAQRLLSTLHDARRMRQEYQRQREQIERQLEALLRVAQPDQVKIQQALLELAATKTRYRQQMLQADQALETFLSAEEQAQYILFQRQFTQQLHDMIVKIRQARLTQPAPTPANFLLRRHTEESVIRQPR